MKKFLLLLIIILFAVIISCESKVDILKDYDGDWINLVENGEFIFTAIRSDDTNDANDTAALVKLRRTLSEKTGIELKVGNDWVKRGEDPPTDTYEILIGLTNRPESIAARQKLGMRDFFIGFYGNRIVIVAGESASVVDAVEFFLENFCNKGENISVPENYEYLHKFDYKITELLLVGEDISSYVIAYTNTEAKTGADRFAYDIGYYTGKRISVINANQASGRMIVFDSGTAFSIKGKDNNLYISGGNELELIYAYEAFLVNYLEGSKISIDVNNVSIDSYTAQNMNKFLTYTAFETKYMRLNIALNGHVLGLYDKASGENYANKGAPTYIVAINKSGVKTPTEANFNDGTAVFTFDEETSLRFKYEISDDYFTLELLDDLGDNVTSVNFFNFNLTRIDEDFMVTLYSMAFQTNPNVYPDGKTTALGGTAYSKFHPKGSKLALIAGPKSEHRTLLKAANQVIDRTKVGYSDIGGANAMDHPGNYGDYIIVSDSSRSAINGYIELSKKYGIDQIDFHYGASTFLNGSFEFIGYNSSAEFKTNVTDKLKEAGIVSGLHTYAHYIVPGDALLLDPKWQQQLGVLSTMTLTEDLSSSDLKLYVDDSSKVTPSVSWFSRNSRYLLIDEEIVSISTYGDNEFIVSRGYGGTKRAEHKAGATVKHLDGVFDLIAPDPNSELFLQVARNTAKAFNEGGFGMIYLDAIDGMGAHVPHDEVWYYNAKFINEILQNCEKSPIIEYSAMFPSMWISRTRMGAWDHPNIGYKEWNRRHVDSNMYYYDMHYPTTLGWYHFAPPVDNTNGKYKFFDDIDYMGSLAIAYNMGIVYIPVAPANQMYVRNMTHYSDIYSKLRKSNYFSEEIKKIIRDTPEKEYAVLQKEDESWAFFEKFYAREKLMDLNLNKLQSSNPFEAQSPFIRIEGHYSSRGNNPITLMEFDETIDLNDQQGKVMFTGEINIINNRALVVNVFGNNSGDAIGIRITNESYGEPAIWDFVIKLDFEGWREFVLVERDNGTLLEYNSFPRTAWDYYAYLRGVCDYTRVSSITVFKHGKCEGVKMSSIVAAQHVSNPIKNPTVQVGDSSVTFNTTISETQYLEYIDGTAKLYSTDGSYVDVAVTGEMIIPPGDFTAIMSADESDIPLRATLTFGFTGPEVK